MTSIETITAVGNIIHIVDKYGAPAVRKIIDGLDREEDPTMEEIEALADMMQDPESYFKKPFAGDPA